MTEQTIDSVRVVATIPTKPEAAAAVRAGLTELAHATRGEAYPGHRVAVIDDHGQECQPGTPGDVAVHPLTPLT